MSLYDFCTKEQLKAGLEWNNAVIAYLVQESEPDMFATNAERSEYFGGVLPMDLGDMNQHQILKALDRANEVSAMGRGVLETLSDALSEKQHIERELIDRMEA